jgi:asparagine synthase (glutamine-hydrolysing)
MRTVRAGECSVAVVGGRTAEDPEFSRTVLGAIQSSHYETLFSKISGPVVVHASLPGRMLVLTEASGLQSAFYARHETATIVADRSDTVARLVGAPIDDVWVAARLTTNGMPPPCRSHSPFVGVKIVPPGHVLSVDRDGRAALARWWSPPAPGLGLGEAAKPFRERLTAAAAAATSGAGVVSCDLSGGLDSMSLAFVLAGPEPTPALLLITFRSTQEGHPDLRWARSAAARLAPARHIEIDPEECPAVFSGLELGSAPTTDDPDGVLALPARLRFHDEVLSALRSDVHVTGHGGDEVTLPLPHSHLAATIRRHPVVGTRQLHGYYALLGRSGLPAFRELARPGPYHEWLAGSAKRVLAADLGADEGARRDRRWGPPPRLPAWVTARTRTLLHDFLLECDGEPLSPLPSQHSTLTRIHAAARSRRLAAQIQTTPPRFSPFLTGDVMELALSVRPHELNTPRRDKPLLVTAMRGTVPDDLLHRTAKGHYDADVATGLRRHITTVRSTLMDGLLVKHGLLDGDEVRRTLRLPFPAGISLSAVVTAVGCEMWLRRQESLYAAADR